MLQSKMWLMFYCLSFSKRVLFSVWYTLVRVHEADAHIQGSSIKVVQHTCSRRKRRITGIKRIFFQLLRHSEEIQQNRWLGVGVLHVQIWIPASTLIICFSSSFQKTESINISIVHRYDRFQPFQTNEFNLIGPSEKSSNEVTNFYLDLN